MKLNLILFLLFIHSVTFAQSNVEGLWLVKRVSIGTEKMTPAQRWFQLNPDGSQESGNGWKKHSEGVWSQSKDTLFFEDSYGLADEYGGFNYSVDKNSMTWKRSEEGSVVTVELVRIDQVPPTDADLLVGLWDIDSSFYGETDITQSIDSLSKRCLHIRWDGIFRMLNTPDGSESGIYRINTHNNSLSLVYRGEPCTSDTWYFEISDNYLKLEMNLDGILLSRHYHRIDKFLD